ncbi:hypothetical protein [Cellulomonas chitinilytica]|uniref:hypothetical protein n=1 Tax=Cellulomonas chitinilytica TaxID=398759 RepID=UPI00194504B2|nr:hypothetical protein [Cellulomonas chitinilytica]
MTTETQARTRRTSAYPVIAGGAGVVAVAAAGLLPESWVFFARTLVPALTFAALWLTASKRVPAGWERTSYAVAAVVTALTSTILGPVTLLLGPVALIAVGLAGIAVAGRHIVPLVVAAVLVVLPIDTRGLELSGGVSPVGLQLLVGTAVLLLGLALLRPAPQRMSDTSGASTTPAA